MKIFDAKKLSGAVLGVALAACFLSCVQTTAPTATGPLTSECDGALHELCIQYTPQSKKIVADVYRDFLHKLGRGIKVNVLCPDREAFDNLRETMGSTECELVPVLCGHAITTWSRDRWLALAPASEEEGRVILFAPRGEAGSELWPARYGDERVGADLAAASNGRIAFARSTLYFDGGDFVTDGSTVFVTPAVLRRNLQNTVRTEDELQHYLAERLKRKVVMLHDVPDHHGGMYMMVAGHATVVVGDPSLARKVLPGNTALCGESGDDFSPQTQARFDSAAAQCAAAGYRVVRIPTVPGMDGRTYITYVNGIIDNPVKGRRIIYMPSYQQAPELNEAAAAVWRGLGFEVQPVNCSAVYTHFGSLHCLVNIVRRG